MYGIINDAVRALVTEKFGAEAWAGICKSAGVDGEYVLHDNYSDEDTLKLVSAAAEALGIEAQQVLELFGQYFLKYLTDNSHDKLLGILGGSLREFLENLDYLHSHLQGVYPHARFPSFRVEALEGGSLVLHYYSDRAGLWGVVKGMIAAIAERLFDISVAITLVSVQSNAANGEHVVFDIKIEKDGDKTTTAAVKQLRANRLTGKVAPKQSLSMIHDLALSSSELLKAWPWHVIFAYPSNCIVHAGHALLCRLPEMKVGDPAEKWFELLRPLHCRWSFEDIEARTNQMFELRIREDGQDQKCGGERGSGPGAADADDARYEKWSDGDRLVLCGEMLRVGTAIISKQTGFAFLCSPKVQGLHHLNRLGLYLSDMTLHSHARDLLFMHTQRQAEVDLLRDKEVLNLALDKEVALANRLLGSMLPAKVAEDLREGKDVPPEAFDCVSIFFSDIVGFTNISAAVMPFDVVRMLNTLYTVMDECCAQFPSCYKVETIGDSYMVVAGAPERGPCLGNATMLANFALNVAAAVRVVPHPVQRKQKLQLRIGIHSGSVAAGVVGTTMPRYCFFGDSVNTASRMESTGVAGKIQCSGAAAQLLRKAGFRLEQRGAIEVKGKGEMVTSWLVGAADSNVLANDAALASRVPWAMDVIAKATVDRTFLLNPTRRQRTHTSSFLTSDVSGPSVRKLECPFSTNKSSANLAEALPNLITPAAPLAEHPSPKRQGRDAEKRPAAAPAGGVSAKQSSWSLSWSRAGSRRRSGALPREGARLGGGAEAPRQEKQPSPCALQ